MAAGEDGGGGDLLAIGYYLLYTVDRDCVY